MAILIPDKVRYENGVKISEKIIPDTAKATKYIASWVPKGGKMKPGGKMTPIGITLHNTSDLKNVYDDAEQYTRATYPNGNMGGAVVHYYVDDTGAWQNLRENEPGWHAGDNQGNGNKRTIAIECIMDGSGSKEDLGARDNAARLIASILTRHNWTLDNLYTHNHWIGLPDKIVYGAKKNCPYYILPKYDDFKKLVQSYMKPVVTESKVPTTSTIDNKVPDIDIGDKVKILAGAKYGGLSTARGKSVPVKCIGVTYTVSKLATHNKVNEALIKEITSWVPIKHLVEIGAIVAGSEVKIKSGAVYGGLSSGRGKKVPNTLTTRTFIVKKVQTNNGVNEALLGGINSWIALSSLTVI